MGLTFAGHLDHAAAVRAVDGLVDLVTDPAVAERWDEESVLPGFTVGGLTRHLVSQPECAVEFLRAPPPEGARLVSLGDYFAGVDWLSAAVDAEENTSIRDDFNAWAGEGYAAAREALDRSRRELADAIAAAGPTTYVPWQDCCLPTDDFVVCRLVEVVVHADDLAVTLGRTTPTFDEPVLDPVVALLATLSARRHGQDAVLRTLSRAERARGTVSAFGAG